MAFRAILSLLLAAASWGALAQSVSNGMALYQATCNSCHGTPPLGGPELAPNNPALIKSAIGPGGINVPAMSFLRGVYSDAQLADIAAYIASIESGPVSGPPPPPSPQFDYSDLWYNAAESGWGLNLVQHAPSNNVFGVIYTYEAPNRPVWYVIPGGTWTSSTIFTGSLYHVTGSPANVASFKLGDVTPVGSATLAFTDANHASFTYTVNGAQVTKSVQRQPF
ncbi:MAG TPA: cytochrome c [Usitatibacter sp.]